jgi:hypothetical protein
MSLTQKDKKELKNKMATLKEYRDWSRAKSNYQPKANTVTKAIDQIDNLLQKVYK